MAGNERDIERAAGESTAAARPETLTADVFAHLSRLELLGDISNQSFLAMGWDHKVTAAHTFSSTRC